MTCTSKNSVRNNFKNIRKKIGTQKDIAEDIGVTETTIRNIENGHSLPSFELSIKLALKFDVPFDKLWQEDFEKQVITT